MQPETHIMIDFEALNTTPDAAVISIGAVVFRVNGLVGTFYHTIDPKSAEMFGSVSRETMEWWDKEENKQARTAAFGGTVSAKDVWYNFADWLQTYDNAYLWSNGADFDLPILKYHLEELVGNYPINFRNHRCYRTLKSFVKHEHVYDSVVRGTKHNALDDAMYQAEVARKCLTYLGYW